MTEHNCTNHDEHLRQLTDVSMRVMVASMDRDAETVARLLTDTATGDHGPADLYSLCCSWADVIMRIGLGHSQRGSGVAAMGVLTLGPDGVGRIAPEDAPPQYRSEIWATRFVAAYVNDDSDTTTALFTTSVDRGEEHVADVVALVGMVGDVLRDRQHQLDGGDR